MFFRYLTAYHSTLTLTVHPHDIGSWYSRADSLACLGRYDDALQSLEQAQELAGFAAPQFWLQKAALFILLNQPKAVLNCCNQALRRSLVGFGQLGHHVGGNALRV